MRVSDLSKLEGKASIPVGKSFQICQYASAPMLAWKKEKHKFCSNSHIKKGNTANEPEFNPGNIMGFLHYSKGVILYEPLGQC